MSGRPRPIKARAAWPAAAILGITLALAAFWLLSKPGSVGPGSEGPGSVGPGSVGPGSESPGPEAASAPRPAARVSYSLSPKEGWIEAVDGAGRILALIPEGSGAAPDISPARTVRVPAKRIVVASGHYDAGIITALSKLDSIVGTDEPAETFKIDEIRAKVESGEIAFVGFWDALDLEAVRALSPDLVITSSPEAGSKLESFGFPTVVTYNGLDNGLENRLRLFGFLGALVGAEREAANLEAESREALKACSLEAQGRPRPKTGWGVFFNNRVYALDGDFWLAEIINICGGDYVMADIRGGSLELDLEGFLERTAEAEIYLASLLHEGRIATRADYLARHPQLARVKAFGEGGRVHLPLDLIFQDTGRLAGVIEAVAAILRPELHPGSEEAQRYFPALP